MINPATLVDAVVSALQTIPALVAAVNGDPAQIFAYHYLYGSSAPLEKALYEMKAPCIMVVFENTLPGDFDGSTLWKHTVNIFIRAANQAQAITPASYEYLWWLVVNGGINGTAVNIRYTQILKNANGSPFVDIMDTPSFEHLKDEDGNDFFVARCTFPELGDN